MTNAEKVLIVRTKIMVTAASQRVGTSIVTKVHAATAEKGDISAGDAVASKKEKNVQTATQRNVKTCKKRQNLTKFNR